MSGETSEHPLDRGLRNCAAALQSGEINATELRDESLRRARDQTDLNAYISLVDHADSESTTGPLAGIPYAAKDNYCAIGTRTTCASRMLENFVAPYDATVIARLRDAGGNLIGKTNLDEFAMGSSNELSHFGAVRNPWDRERVPGGSSGGSAVAVASCSVPFALGSDTGGSVRQPAAFCGVTGFKPTYGRISRYGLVAYASSLDCPGIIARSAEDCAIVFDAIAGHDERDATSARRAVESCSDALELPLVGLRIGIAASSFGAGIDDEVARVVRDALSEFERQGATIVDIDLPHAALAIPAYYVIAPAEASSNLSRYDGVRYGHRCENPTSLDDLYGRSRAEGFGEEVQRRIFIGTYVLSAGYYDAYYRRAQQVRQLIAKDFDTAFERVDLIAAPTAPTTAFRIGEKIVDPVQLYASDINTVSANLAGVPAISLPAGFSKGLPVGLQLTAPAFGERRLLAAAHQFQQATDWHKRRPGAGQ
ncbi:MAG: Asp-tRNA(Asn)/Glu-tRNA(Gln) amidotransferase subunit GatA [Dokdonella sp.]